jgi:hypothetical protein
MSRAPHLIWLLAILAISFESAPLHAAKTGNCEITVTQTIRSGRPKKRVFRTHADSKDHCAQKAEHHKLNFAPTRVKSKKVKFKFKPAGNQ